MLCLKRKPVHLTWWLPVRTAHAQLCVRECDSKTRLACGDARSFMLQAGWRVRCESGLVWLTQNGDAIDHLLREGQEWQCNHAGHAVLQALEQAGAVVEISSCATAPPK